MSSDTQARIDEIEWYHEFEFGNGLSTRAKTPDVEAHRRIWAFIEANLADLDFSGKTVLDVGCWDGFWSFYAERRGARSVLASDDASQNWAGPSGLRLAHELLDSSVEINTNLSIYELSTIGRRFDIVLCLGVYYHLIDPIYAFAQIRHCCHPETIVIIEGDATKGIPASTIMYQTEDHGARPVFVPTVTSLTSVLGAAYLSVRSTTWLDEPRPPRSPLLARRAIARYLEKACERPPAASGRLIVECSPMTGPNHRHLYRPPFGLDVYDDRWS